MSTYNHIVNLVLSIFLIVGVYQFYFWCQRNTLFEPREFGTSLDDLIPYIPAWVWIYSFLYYPAILCVNLAMKSAEQFTYVALSYMMLLAMQMIFFLLFPVRTPDHWRAENNQEALSERFLAFVRKFDASTNSFPSMHTSVATLTAMHLYGSFGSPVFLFPLLIGLSCLFTKQHYVVDVPAGAFVGWLDYLLYMKMFAY